MPAGTLPCLALARSLPRRTDVLVAGYRQAAVTGLPETEVAAFRKRYGTDPAELATALGATDTALSTVVLPGASVATVVLVGLGDKPVTDLTGEELRALAGAGVRALSRRKDSTGIRLAISFDRTDAGSIRAIGEGALLGSYSFRPVTAGRPADPQVSSVTVLSRSTGKAQLAAVESAQTVARAVVANREWVNQPANLLYPETFADDVAAQVAGTRIGVEVLDETALTAGGYGGILAVGGGSERPPRLVRLSYAPRGAKVHLGLVGKGITFDSGGLDIKTQTGMYTMKSDMSGAGAVFAATRAIADLGLKIKVTTYGALAENMPSGSAYRPSDVLTTYGGTTVENFNSDAEGRIVMADALARLSSEDRPDLIVDVATLTGACIMALGERTGGVMSNRDDTARQLLAAAAAAGERFWQLPITDESRGFLDSEVADLKSGRSGPGGAMTAAAFLREFVGDVAWAHLDIAGPAFNTGPAYGYVSSGGTGIGVRTLVALAEQLIG